MSPTLMLEWLGRAYPGHASTQSGMHSKASRHAMLTNDRTIEEAAAMIQWIVGAYVPKVLRRLNEGALVLQIPGATCLAAISVKVAQRAQQKVRMHYHVRVQHHYKLALARPLLQQG